VVGALRGLETFSQLVLFDFDGRHYVITKCPLRIDDAPVFAYRGLMLDTR
jgi:hexosaminidase